MIKQVQVVEATYYGKPFSGTFPFVSIADGDTYCKRDCYVTLIKDGKTITAQAWRNQLVIDGDTQSDSAAQIVSSEDTAHVDVDKLAQRISRRFVVMNRMSDGIINGNIRSLILTGAPGIGKSHELERKLEKAEEAGTINKFTVLKGRITGVALFAQLFMHKDKGDVLVLDDIDSIFSDESSLNLLKAALDSGDRRILAWLSASTWLEEQGVDKEFEFNGSVVFISNLDFDAQIERGVGYALHLRALISRSIYLSLAVHTPLEIMIRVDQVVRTGAIRGVSNADVQEAILGWMWDNYARCREISLRTVLKIRDMILSDGDEWEELASVTLLRGL